MQWIGGIWRRLVFFFRRGQFHRDLDEEMSEHVRMKTQALADDGIPSEEAHDAARLEFGNPLLLRERSRDAWGFAWLETLLQDVRYGLRQLRRNPGFTAVAVITLGLGIGATTAIFSAVYGVLLRPLPYPKPNQIVSVSEVASDGHLMHFADPNFDDIRAANHTLADMAEFDHSDVETVIGPSGAARIGVSAVSQDFFRVMGVSPIIGRGFRAAEQRQGAGLVALVSYGYWRQVLNGSPAFSSVKLTMAGHAFSVVGVMPPGFSFPAGSELWFPRGAFGETPSRTSHNASVVARMRDGVTLAQARSDLSSIAGRLYRQYKPDIDMTNTSVLPLRTSLTASVRPALLILLGAVGFLLLVGCANVANLLLARATARERELAIRSALGASRGRLVRQFLAESLLLALFGGAMGALLAIWGVDGLLAYAPRHLPRIENVSVNLPVLAFALGISFLVAVGLAVATALHSTSTDPQRALAEGSRGAGSSIAAHRLGHSLIAGQVAITLVLLTGAGLLGRSLLRVLSVDPGFRTQNIVTMEMEVPGSEPTNIASAINSLSDTRPAAFMSALFARLREVPGVQDVGGISALPLEGGMLPDGKFLLLDHQPRFNLANPKDDARLEQLWVTAPGSEADFCIASGGYFRALGIPLLRGRLFNEHDTASSPQVALISESLSRSVWPREDPIGRTIDFGNMDGDLRLLTVVGVVGNVRDHTLERPAEPTVYVNYRQRLRAGRGFSVVIRSAASPESVLSAVRAIVRGMDPDAAPRFRTFQAVYAASLESRKFNVTLVGVFAGAALLLAVVGIYGVTTFWVNRRTREFGIRIAFGAQKGNILSMVVGLGLKLALIGVASGIAGALVLTRFLSSLLYGVKPTDPLTFVGVSVILTTVALVACYIPARRATKVDPMVALRYE